MSEHDPVHGTDAADIGPDGTEVPQLPDFEDSPLVPLVPDDPDAAEVDALVAASQGDDEPEAAVPAEARGTSALARVYSALLSRQGETQVERRLDATERACRLLGDVHKSAPVVMLTGTNGKSSTARMVDAILSAAGLRVGRFTSPHLHRVTERIAVDGEEVSERVFVDAYDAAAPILEMVDAELVAADRPKLTFFEALTVLAFAIFAEAPVDVMVIEVGMGGEWDSTNVADAAVCGFAPIGYDHQAYLGDTLTEIAATKAGILNRSIDPTPSPDPVAVIAEQTAEAAEALAVQTAARGAAALWAGQNFWLRGRERAVDGQLIDVQGLYSGYPDLFLPLHGEHQAHNAALAIAMCEAFLADADKPLNSEIVAEGMSQVTSPGRAEILRTEPTILVDGAHNPAAAEVLADTIDEAFDFEFVVAVVAMFADKDPHGVLEYVHRFADRIVVSEALSPRALEHGELAAAAAEWFDPEDVTDTPDLNAALMAAIDLVNSQDSRHAGIVVTGSLLTVAEARTLLGKGGIQ